MQFQQFQTQLLLKYNATKSKPRIVFFFIQKI